jgi:peptidoglycan/xylan/chitin deacetylase (PgdA/CDA1 family)
MWNRLLRTWAARHETIVLTYHRVIEKWDRTIDYSQPGMVVTAETFDRHLQFLKKHFEIVPLSSLVTPQSEIRNPKSFARPRCVITFDDGWRDNYTMAYPILRKHGVSATIFLTTDFIGTDRAFWHTEMMYLLLDGDLQRMTSRAPMFEGYPAALREHLVRLARMKQALSPHDVDPFIEAVKESCNEDTIQNLIRDIASVLDLFRPFFAGRRFFLDWHQVGEMAAKGLEIGSHGCSHRMLTRLDSERVEQELMWSKKDIERHLGIEVQHFAFPNGAANHDLIARVGKVGYKTACLCELSADETPSYPLTLRRAGMHEGVGAGGDGTLAEGRLVFWLSRAPRAKPA